MQLLTAYTINQEHNFLFPLAEGNLKELLNEETRPLGFQNDNQFFQALYQIASAIEAVHNYFSEEFNLHQIGCHYDLKPENVLYQNGTLILSDFGLSRLAKEADGSRSLYRHGGGEYMAPESVSIKDDFESLPVGRPSDMWSFGCILSEMLTYIKKGRSGVVAFSEKREIIFEGYFECRAFHAGTQPHPEVVDFLSNLNQDLDTRAQAEVMELVQKVLQIEPSRRPKAKCITTSLFHAAQHDSYCSIKRRFDPLIASHLEFQIEYERLLLWGEYSGIAVEACHYEVLEDRNDWKTFADLQQVQEGLYRLECELETLSSILKHDNAKATRLAYHIQKAVDSLWDIQPLEIRRQMIRALENRLLSRGNGELLTAMELSEEDMAEATNENSILMQPLHKRIVLLATMKQVAAGLESRSLPNDNMQIEPHRIQKAPKRFHWHSIGSYEHPRPSQVLIEYLEYGPAWYGRTDELIQRVQDIACCRAVEFPRRVCPVLKCVAFYHDVGKHLFGIVYDFPPKPTHLQESAPTGENITSLRAVLSKVQSRKERPSLDVVFALAIKLTNVVFAMHEAKWLHKSISSYNIVFFPDRFSTIAEALTSPYFIGFNYSRLNLGTAFTQGPSKQLDYQHPEYIRNREKFSQEYEYFSVGLVLLELGFWSPLEQITSNIRGSQDVVARSLLEEYVPILKTYMGTAYAEAVAVCLSGDLGGSSNPVEVREAFDERVLRRIESKFRLD